MATCDALPLPEHGRKFELARKRLNWTQEKLAEMAVVAPNSVKNAEAGKSIGPGTHAKIVDALNKERASKRPELPVFSIEYPPQFLHGARRISGDGRDALRPELRGGSNNNFHLAAVKNYNLHLEDAVKRLRIGRVESERVLRELFLIDDEAYGDDSISYELFKDLWSAFPQGLIALYCDDRIIGAIGIWPLDSSWAERLKNGRIRERDLDPGSMKKYRTRAAAFWHISGVVLSPSASPRAVRTLLADGIRTWRIEAKIAFPSAFLALASSDEGRLMLERFGFFRIQNASAMPDKLPLYELVFDSTEDLIQAMRKRSLPVD